jgi:hypothetical protein
MTKEREQEIVATLYQWVSFLEQENYQSAYALTDHEGPNWTPVVLQKLIENYGSLEPLDERFLVTDRLAAQGTSIDPEFQWFPKPEEVLGELILGILHFELPLNGEWSDLTAIFYIVGAKASSEVRLKLTDIHVM